jgi:hypothetical protein
VDNPDYSSIVKIKEDKKKKDRAIAGLSEEFIDIKDYSKEPSITYVAHPSIVSKSQLLT